MRPARYAHTRATPNPRQSSRVWDEYCNMQNGKETAAMGMLILTRRVDEDIYIGNDARLVVLGIKGGQVKIGVEAKPSVEVDRGEIRARKRVERAAPSKKDPADTISNAEAQCELRKLIEFFRSPEGDKIGRSEGYDNLSTAETAIRAMRKLLALGHDPV